MGRIQRKILDVNLNFSVLLFRMLFVSRIFTHVSYKLFNNNCDTQIISCSSATSSVEQDTFIGMLSEFELLNHIIGSQDIVVQLDLAIIRKQETN